MNLEDDLHNLRPAFDRAINEAAEDVPHSTMSPRARVAGSRPRAAVAALIVVAAVVAAVAVLARLDTAGRQGGGTKAFKTTLPPTTTVYTTTSTSTPPTTTSTTQAGVALRTVRWASVVYPIEPHCRPFSPAVSVRQVAYPVPVPGVQLAVVLVRCNSGAGTPPVAVYVYDRATSTGSPHLAGTLVTDGDGWQAATFGVNGATISLPVAGFSSGSLPNCCPDVRATLVWRWSGSKYELVSPIPPHVKGPAFGYY